jgi:hypothetical protein
MTKLLLAGVAGVVLTAGVAFADTYPPTPPPSMPLAPPPAVSSPGDNNPPAAGLGSGVTTTAPNPGGNERDVTIHKEVDEKGNRIIEKDTHREGIAGSTESHTKQETDRNGGTTTTRSKTTTDQE